MALRDRLAEAQTPGVVDASERRPRGFVLLQRSNLAQRMNAARAEGKRLLDAERGWLSHRVESTRPKGAGWPVIFK